MIAAFFGTLLAGIKTTLVLAFLGASVGVGSLVIGRLITGLQGYAAAAVLGAVVLVGAYGSAAFDGVRVRQKQAEIAQLQVEKAKLAKDLDVQLIANSMQDQVTAAQAKQLDADRIRIARIESLVTLHQGDTSACIFPDELHEIFKP